MELIVFIIIIAVIILIYYLIETIRSLTEEIKEIKSKCVENGNTQRRDFHVYTEDPLKSINMNMLEKLNYLKVFFDK